MKNLPLLLTVVGLSLLWGCHHPKDFDVVATKGYDLNGLPLNPQWGQQTRRVRPGEQNPLPDPYVSCPVEDDSDNPDLWTKSPQYPHCTSFPITFNGGFWCGPHVNFEPITYEGFVTWDHHAFDDDYDLNVTSPDSALYSTIASRVHIEFDSDETVDNWDDTGTWWNRFHHNGVDHCYWKYINGNWECISDGDAQASAMINGSFVIVIGMLNLDTSHHGKTEIHPVYAMFVRRLPDSDCGGTRVCWAFFVRNWGDEGFCSDDDVPFWAGGHTIKIIIPNVAGLISQNVWEGAQNADEAELSQMQSSMAPSGDGVLLTFTLLPPDKQSWFVGDFTFIAPTRTTPVTPRPTISTSAAAQAAQGGRNPSGESEPEERLGPDLQALEARIAKLPADSRIELYRQLQYLTPRKKSSPVKTVVLFEPAKDEHVHPSAPAKAIPPRKPGPSDNKSTVQLRRQKKIEFIKQYLAEKEKKT